jgi:hypothetical protein
MPNPSLESIFRSEDQSALIDNYVTSEDPPPGAWSWHSSPQSPLGKVSFPEVLSIVQGLVYTRGKSGQLIEHHLLSKTWTPWHYEGRGRAIEVDRAVARDVFFGRIRLNNPKAGLLVLECVKGPGVEVSFERIPRGLKFHWQGRFEATLEFGGRALRIDLSDTPNVLKTKFAETEPVLLNDAQAQWHWKAGRSLWVGVQFRKQIEVKFAVQRLDAPREHAGSLKQAIREEKRRWETFFNELVPPLKTKDPVLRDTYHFAWQVIWANRCEGGSGLLRQPYTSPARLHYGSQWWWDDAFHSAVFGWLKDPALPYRSWQNFWPAMKKDGLVPGAMRFTVLSDDYASESIGVQTVVTQPPVIGVVLQLLRDQPGWPKDLRPLYEPLSRYADWLAGPTRDTDQDGLTEYFHANDTGWDQAVRWDPLKADPKQYVPPLVPTEGVDVAVFHACLCDALAQMADRLGDASAARRHRDRGARILERIESLMWNESDGFYYDIKADTHEPARIKTPAGFIPLLLEGLDKRRAERLVREHLLNEREFWTQYPLPSVSIDDPRFDERNMWRGPCWVNINWLVMLGLQRQGFDEEATMLARRTVEMVGPRYRGRTRVRSPRVWEWYNPLTGAELGNCQYSWSALVIDMILRVLSPQ